MELPVLSPAIGAPSGAAAAVRDTRSTRERLGGVLRRGEEALSPRALRRTLAQLQAVADPRVSEVEGGRRAQALAQWYARASADEQRDCWLLMSEQFGPDPQRVKAARERYEQALGSAEEGAAEAQLRRALSSPRARLLQRFAVYPEGIRFLVDLRAQLQASLKSDRRLLALDGELEGLLSTWFDVAFLELQRISWDSPASLIEKLIRYEAVHDIRSWADVKNRLDSDRRCYGFFHPRLPGEPLIFVEVALLKDIAAGIGPLLDESAAPSDPSRATTAIFYSISNTQSGLRGVSFGDSLIKRVVETLKAEFPRLRQFATLSPIPGLRAWLAREGQAWLTPAWAGMNRREREALLRALATETAAGTTKDAAKDAAKASAEPASAADAADGPTPAAVLRALDAAAQSPDAWAAMDERHPLRLLLMRAAARYLASMDEGKPLDPVARFHLGNGARVERLNWAGDPSAKGLRQSLGLMVNYLYDLKRLDRHREMLAAGKIPMAADIEDL